jgi:hypothetical protein
MSDLDPFDVFLVFFAVYARTYKLTNRGEFYQFIPLRAREDFRYVTRTLLLGILSLIRFKQQLILCYLIIESELLSMRCTIQEFSL